MPNVDEAQIYFSAFTGEVRTIFNQDMDKFKVLAWIIFNTNYSEQYKDLKERECYFSFSLIENIADINRKKALRIIKELEDEGFIEWVFKSKSKHKKSIIKLLEKGTGKSTGEGTSKGTGKSIENKGIEECKEPVREPVEEPVKEPLSKKQSKKQNNIYSQIINEIIEYLNLKAKKNFRANTKKTIQIINSKLNDGYELDDFKKVIDIKTTEWINTDFDKFLRPSTLFGSKFEEYLNQLSIKPKVNNPYDLDNLM